jgi:hypothetical protein
MSVIRQSLRQSLILVLDMRLSPMFITKIAHEHRKNPQVSRISASAWSTRPNLIARRPVSTATQSHRDDATFAFGLLAACAVVLTFVVLCHLAAT